MTKISESILSSLAAVTCAIAACAAAYAVVRPVPLAPMIAAVGAGDQAAAQPRGFTVSGVATIEAVPDVAVIQATLAVDDPSAEKATRTVTERQKTLMDALERASVARKDISSSGLQLSPVYDNRGVVAHYHAAIGVKVSATDFQRLPTLMNVLAAAGATGLGTELRVADLPALKKKLRGMAVEAAKAKASELSAAVGFDIGQLRSVVEAPGDNWGWNGVYANVTTTENAPAASHGDLQTLTLSVNLTYDLS